MFDKFDNRVKRFGWRTVYAQLEDRYRRHHDRFKAFIEAMPRKLVCQECGGGGGWKEPVLDDGTGPWFDCGYCEGTGYVSPWMRGQWLQWKRKERAALRATSAAVKAARSEV